MINCVKKMAKCQESKFRAHLGRMPIKVWSRDWVPRTVVRILAEDGISTEILSKTILFQKKNV